MNEHFRVNNFTFINLAGIISSLRPRASHLSQQCSSLQFDYMNFCDRLLLLSNYFRHLCTVHSYHIIYCVRILGMASSYTLVWLAHHTSRPCNMHTYPGISISIITLNSIPPPTYSVHDHGQNIYMLYDSHPPILA